MTALTSTGLGSGLDINSIVTAIVGAEKDPALAKMVSESADATAAISAYGTLNSELSAFKDSYHDLSRTSTFSAASATSSDSGVLDATLGIGAATGSWSFEVEQCAQAQTIVSSAENSYPEATSEVGTGVISFSFGSYGVDEAGNSVFNVNPDKAIETLTIDASNNSLDKMRDAINEGDYSVSASIIDDGSEYRLVLTNKETGEENAMQITVVDDDGNNDDTSGLSSLTYSADIKHLEQTSVAQDAKIVMNGIEITRPSNTISNVIEGVTLNINGETEIGKTVSLNISQDTSNVKEQLTAFVDNYNNTINQMNSLTAYGGESGTDGALHGDSTIRNIQSQMRNVLNSTMRHIEGSVQSFADLGMLTNRDGTLTLDSDKLDAMMKTDMASIANFFTASGGASDSLVAFESNSGLTAPGTYDIEVTKLATQGQLTGSAYSLPITIDASDSFKMRLDGYLSDDITLTPGTYENLDDFMVELQSKINSDSNFVENGLNVSILENIDAVTGAKSIAIASNSYGLSSTVAITELEGSNLSSLAGFSVGGGINGENVEGLIDGMEAYGDGQYLLSQSGDSTGIKVAINGGEIGARGTVTYAEGMSTMLDNMLDGMIDTNISSADGDIETSGSTIDSKVDSLYKKIALLEEKEETLNYRMDKLETRLYTQFNAMDMAVSGLNNTMEYLKSSLEALPGYGND